MKYHRRNNNQDSEPKALPVRAFAAQFGKDPHWIRRQVNKGKIKAIRGFGEMLIPMTEVDVILDSIQQDITERHCS
jgi:hypothetical protein